MNNELDSDSGIYAALEASLITMDLEGYITGWNHGAALLFGYSADEVLGKHILLLYADAESEGEEDFFNEVIANGHAEMDVKRRRKDGSDFWAHLHLTLVRNKVGQPTRLIGYVRDISSQLANEERSRLYTRIIEYAREAIVITDSNKLIVSVNNAYLKITGRSNAEVIGTVPSFLKKKYSTKSIEATLKAMGHWEGELWDSRADGEVFPAWLTISAVQTNYGTVSHYFVVFSDLTEKRLAEEKIHKLAYYDTLTNLPNRAMLFSLLAQSLAEAKRKKKHGSLLCFNINSFKHINDSFGHSEADTLLAELARRIRTALREEDVVSRFSGDEFYIALFEIEQREDAILVARRILQATAAPFYLKNQEIVLLSHIGISIYPDDGYHAETLINNATVAMQRAKKSNQNYLFYSSEMNRRSLDRIKLEAELHHALDLNQFELFFQPQIDLPSKKIMGAEALIRWRHPQKGMIPPSNFIPFAEETGLIVGIGSWVLNEAISQIAEWKKIGIKLNRLAINLSALQFKPQLPDELSAILSYHKIPAELVELELTESLLMGNGQSSLLNQLHSTGFSLALDDFGTGYSNLAYLQHYPIDYLKIDQSFVQALPDNQHSAAIVRSIVDIATNLGLKLIAEGVETQAQADYLSKLGCHLIQGYFCYKPMSASDFTQLLIEQQGKENQA
ncbi:EAL domain-containing protein [Iodobacter sp. HSC-16F04]|uniref:EAL domain-containing protein n=1 Tax=Iodobacter violaceini TaxID=3044271 RepID=A0ABX0L129_9NEIS|nr:EAL domain-containing protein [Iodobacter violacea]NHQ87929.1 EAL domain-containing protein [Iodobacter violacea]